MGGFVAGLAGAALTIGSTGGFQRNVSAGNGFIALAALIFGRWTPRGAVGAALFFGFAEALQVVLSFLHTPVTIPSYFLAMLPYIATIVAVAGLVGRVRAPAADGEPYTKELTPQMAKDVGTTVDWAALRALAVEAMGRAYAPYSHYPVGVAALVDDGRLVSRAATSRTRRTA